MLFSLSPSLHAITLPFGKSTRQVDLDAVALLSRS